MLILLSYELESNNKKIYELSEFFEIIKKTEISKEDSKKLISKLEQILERYVYLDILKNPPQPSKNYHNIVDIIKELNEVNTDKRPLYEFYRDIKIIIDKCQDLHLDLKIKREFESNIFLEYSIFIFPMMFLIKDNQVISYPISILESYFDPNLMDKIYSVTGWPITSINNLNPIDYIQTFNRDFRKLKSPQAQFVFNQNNIFLLPVISYPFEINNLSNIKIVYSSGTTINVNYKVICGNDPNILLNYFDAPDNNNSNFSFQLLKPKINLYKSFIDNSLNDLKWNFSLENGKLKCRVDNVNEVNVIFQKTFNPSSLESAMLFIDNCFSSFDNNAYPIVIIEEQNGGGYVTLADYFLSYINLYKTSPIYSSFRYNENVKSIASNFAGQDTKTCKAKYADKFFDLQYIEDDYGIDQNGAKIKHKRTQIFDKSTVDKAKLYDLRKNTKYIRKPNEIIIFTDGFSYSATSLFIKETQIKGGAIIVGYSGNPNLDSFDSSQSPSPVFSTDSLKGKDTLSDEIMSLGFSFNYPIMEIFNKLDNENEKNIPLEYQINEIDERVNIFNGYDDSLYQNFIDNALLIFKKYKTKCNPKNKNLLLLSNKCTFTESYVHGGYECNATDGTWSKTCVPSYCNNGYIFDNNKKECVKDVCLARMKTTGIYYFLTVLFFVLFLICLILYKGCSYYGRFTRKNYLLCPIALFLILFIVFLILYIVI
jgi:hypothetical protein